VDQLPVQLFEYGVSSIRVVTQEDGPWFVAGDVCRILELDPSVSVNGQNRMDSEGNSYRSGGLDEDEKATHNVSTPGGEQTLIVVSEPGLYSLVLKSRKPEAKAFKRWITHEVLPTIRTQGYYARPTQPTYQLPQTYIEALEALVDAEKVKLAQAEQLRLQEPKIALYDVAMQAVNAQPVGTIAKVLGVGPNKLFAWLREEKILMSHGARKNLPMQEFMDRGLFEVREYTITHLTHGIENKVQTMVTPKGLAYIQQRWNATHEAIAQ